MKNSLPPFICILMCLLPTLMAAQAPQEQNPTFRSPILFGDTYLTTRQMTDDPLLRLSRTGPIGEEGIMLDMTTLPLLETGPSIRFFYLQVPYSGNLRMIPSPGGPELRLMALEDPNHDILVMDLGDPIVAPFRPSIVLRKPLVGGLQSAIVLGPSENYPRLSVTNSSPSSISLLSDNAPALNTEFELKVDLVSAKETHSFRDLTMDLQVERTYDKATPKLLERISSGNAGTDSFFDIFYDLEVGKESRLFGDPDFDLLVTRTYDKATPKLLERISSGNAGVASFFDIFYDIELGMHTLGLDSLRMTKKFEPAVPRVLISVGKNGSPNVFDRFDLSYDLSDFSETHLFADDVSDLLLIHTYDKSTPKLLTRVMSNHFDDYFDVAYNVSLGEETRSYGDPDFDLLVTRTYDKATPKLLERISSGSAGIASFFDITYDISLGKESRLYGDPDFDLLVTRTYDKATPKLLERISSGNAGADSFFDIFYDLELGKETHTFGDPDIAIIVGRTYDKATPKLLERIESSDPVLAGRFFEISHDISLGGGGATGKVAFQDLHFATKFEPATPRLQQHIVSSNPIFADNFFDIEYVLGGSGAGAGKVAYQDLSFTSTFMPAAPRLLQRIYSSKPEFADSFFDITYDLDLGSITSTHQGFKHVVQYNESEWDFINRFASDDPLIPDFFDISYDLELGIQRTKFKDLHCSLTASEPSTICWQFASDFPGTPDFFDICYDLDANEIKTEMVAMNLVASFDPVEVRHRTTLTSDIPATPGFMEVAMDISNQDLLVHSRRAGVFGLPSMEMKYEYDGLSRLIREVTVDESSGVTLSLERRLSASGAALSVGGRLFVEGPVSSESGPLLIIDDAQLNGFLTINGGLQVTGPKMFRIDHPLDPNNKYLQHSCVESPDMMNVYNGNIVTDEKGYATILLPNYFEALNSDFRYQLTCMGQFAQAIVAKKMEGNQFTIQTDKPGVEVSWQVTGIRKDPAALNSGYAVEVMK